MPHIKASIRQADEARAIRMIIAWIDGDRLAFDTAATEASADKLGTSGLVYALTAIAATLGEQVTPEIRDRLRGVLLPDPDVEQDQA